MAHEQRPQGKLVSLQYVRALAAIIVVGWHTGFSYTFLGQAGVDLFFIVSGFVMMLVSGRESSASRFATSRFLRVVPLYWAVTLIVAVSVRAPVSAVVSSLLFWPDRPFPVVIQGWSLNLEMLYYVLFALALEVPGRRRLVALTIEMTVLCFVVPLMLPDGAVVTSSSNPLAFEFLAGAYLYKLWRFDYLPLGAAAWVMGLAGLVTLAATHALGGAPAGWVRVAFWGVPSFAMVAAGLAIERSGQLPRLRLLEVLGDASYAIYLTHMLVISLVAGILHSMWAPIALSIAIIWACVVGYLVHRFVERPMHRATSAAVKRLRPVAPAT